MIANQHGTVSYSKVAPCLGIGGGNPVVSKKGLAFTWDAGVIFTGSPRVDLAASCGVSISASTCADVQSNAAVEKQKLEGDVHK
jgi:hypothetical protein